MGRGVRRGGRSRQQREEVLEEKGSGGSRRAGGNQKIGKAEHEQGDSNGNSRQTFGVGYDERKFKKVHHFSDRAALDGSPRPSLRSSTPSDQSGFSSSVACSHGDMCGFGGSCARPRHPGSVGSFGGEATPDSKRSGRERSTGRRNRRSGRGRGRNTADGSPTTTENPKSEDAVGISSDMNRVSCFTCGGYGHRTKDCTARNFKSSNRVKDSPQQGNVRSPRRPGGRSCFTCGAEGHRAIECPNESKQGFSRTPSRRSEGLETRFSRIAVAASCDDSGGAVVIRSPRNSVLDLVCSNCGRDGHLRVACPELQENEKPKLTCFLCKKEDHNQAGCPLQKPDAATVPAPPPEQGIRPPSITTSHLQSPTVLPLPDADGSVQGDDGSSETKCVTDSSRFFVPAVSSCNGSPFGPAGEAVCGKSNGPVLPRGNNFSGNGNMGTGFGRKAFGGPSTVNEGVVGAPLPMHTLPTTHDMFTVRHIHSQGSTRNQQVVFARPMPMGMPSPKMENYVGPDQFSGGRGPLPPAPLEGHLPFYGSPPPTFPWPKLATREQRSYPPNYGSPNAAAYSSPPPSMYNRQSPSFARHSVNGQVMQHRYSGAPTNDTRYKRDVYGGTAVSHPMSVAKSFSVSDGDGWSSVASVHDGGVYSDDESQMKCLPEQPKLDWDGVVQPPYVAATVDTKSAAIDGPTSNIDRHTSTKHGDSDKAAALTVSVDVLPPVQTALSVNLHQSNDSWDSINVAKSVYSGTEHHPESDRHSYDCAEKLLQEDGLVATEEATSMESHSLLDVIGSCEKEKNRISNEEEVDILAQLPDDDHYTSVNRLSEDLKDSTSSKGISSRTPSVNEVFFSDVKESVADSCGQADDIVVAKSENGENSLPEEEREWVLHTKYEAAHQIESSDPNTATDVGTEAAANNLIEKPTGNDGEQGGSLQDYRHKDFAPNELDGAEEEFGVCTSSSGTHRADESRSSLRSVDDVYNRQARQEQKPGATELLRQLMLNEDVRQALRATDGQLFEDIILNLIA